ncbi:phosphate signaling complex protein PhoU [Clostridium senegalense]|uniref:Phosphate-specific transport system accessory protein PhoU n=1 Tax=Clostridium senegalense TaxID=1465809 RepID=A0A6M0GZJ2_9CLOT|nr:phosphate signaling complex protein PhoU [Clostridium senegalense]NEU04016.1 phosphate signaling complex protein PhoU [Clostridium senegalense]
MNANIRKNFENEILKLNEKLTSMGNITIEMYKSTVKALKENDKELALKIIKKDSVINELNDEINNEAVILIAKQSPVAIDLRTIITIIKISTEIERIADYTKNISNYILAFNTSNCEGIQSLNNEFIKAISILTNMINKTMDSYENESLEDAKVAATLDDEIDNIYKSNLKKFVQGIKKTENEQEIDQYLQAIMVNKHLERAGDHVTNIVEEVMYYIKGKRYRL